MKKFLLFITALIAIVATSCDNRENIQGQWKSNPIKIDFQNQLSSASVLTFTFAQDGKVTINADINTNEMVAAADSIPAGLISVPVTAMINGTWQYARGENDEVIIKFDDSSLAINIDPEAVSFSGDASAAPQSSAIANLKATTIAKYKALLGPQMAVYFSKFSKLEDIKADSNTLSFEIDHKNAPDEHFTLDRI